jgi:hypothetical protein
VVRRLRGHGLPARLTRALGRAALWQDTQIDLLENGIYQPFHQLLGVPYERPDMTWVTGERARREAILGEYNARATPR